MNATRLGGRFPLPSVYAVIDVEVARKAGLHAVEASVRVLAAYPPGADPLIQLRAKSMDDGSFLQLARDWVRQLQRRFPNAQTIINDRADIAMLSGADGVHLGQDDLPPAAARRLLGADKVIGYSTHNEAQLRAAIGQPCDYLAIGPVYATSTKENPDPVVGLDGVRRARELYQGALVAIGGISLENCAPVWQAGADSVALIGDLFKEDPAARVRKLLSRYAPLTPG